jgi:uncharacterized membrane protein
MLNSGGIEGITKKNVELISKMESSSITSRTTGERIADIAATCVGSWTFLITQSVLLAIWVILNVGHWWQPWDPYPFVLLNLVLSFEAAFATPVILMSQNRQSQLTERRNQLDLQINLLAEQENTAQLKLLRLLCEKAGIKLAEPDEAAFEQAVHPDEIIRQIVEGGEAKPRQS